ncbi:MAG: hypothetical protein AAGA88_06430 [Pseudomonadota bacterium]
MRDELARADDLYWKSVLSGEEFQTASVAYEAHLKRARGLVFQYRTADEIAANDDVRDLFERFEHLLSNATTKVEETALLGLEDKPYTRLSEALELYKTKWAARKLAGKSHVQRKRWAAIPDRAVATFIEVVGDKDIHTLTRDDARAFHEYWLHRIAPTRPG